MSSETKVLNFKTNNAENTVEALLELPNVKADIIGGLHFYSKASGELVDEDGNAIIWRVGLTVSGKPCSPGVIEVEYRTDPREKPAKWIMKLLFEALDKVEAQLITKDKYTEIESV